MRVDDVLDVDAAIEQLVRLVVRVLARVADVALSSSSGKKRDVRRTRHGRPVSRCDELAEILGRDLRHAVDVLRHRRDVLGHPRGRRAGRRRQRAAERARRAREDERADARVATASSSRFSVPVTFVSTKSCAPVRRDVRLVQRRRVQHRVDAAHARRTKVAVGDRADARR